jgi:arabinogalactan oligomer / maltooligosaccharide transport system substrate-binding protein
MKRFITIKIRFKKEKRIMKKLSVLFSLLVVMGLMLSACGGAKTPAPATAAPATAAPATAAPATAAPATAAPAAASDLLLWVYDDTRTATLAALGEEFKAQYGVGVKVQVIDLSEIRNAMTLGAASGEGPDMIIIPHDNLGPMVENGSAAVIDLGGAKDNILPNAIQGFTYNGKLYGLPLSVENIGFFRNTDMVKDAPKTWDEVAQIGTDLVKSGKATSAIGLPDLTYNIYPLFTSYGGYIFGRDASGNFTVDDFGMNNDGMGKGLAWVKKLVDAKAVSSTIDWEASHVAFETGKSPFIMTGPWAITRFKKAGVHYAISPFPAAEAGGKPGYPFMGVQGLVVNANKPNAVLAQTFVEFLATEKNYQALFAADTRPSAWKSVFEGATDADTAAFNAAGVNADPMPSIPAMGYVWDAWVAAGNLVVTGQKSPKDALDAAVAQVLEQVKK